MKKVSLLFAAVFCLFTLSAQTVINVDDYKSVSFTTTDGEYTFLASKGGASNDPVYKTNTDPAWGNDIRVYANGIITITSKTKNIKAIEFVMSTQGKIRWANLTPSAGDVTPIVANGITVWQGDTSYVDFTVGAKAELGTDASKAGQFCFNQMIIYAEGDPEFEIPEVKLDTVKLNIHEAYYRFYDEYSEEGAYDYFTVLADTVTGVGLAFDLYMAEMEQFPGTYNVDNDNIDVSYSYYYYGEDDDDYADADDAWMTITATPIPDEYHFVGGMLVGTTLYLVDYTGPFEESGNGSDPYAYETSAPTTINFTAENAYVEDSWAAYGYYDLYLFSGGTDLDDCEKVLYLPFLIDPGDAETFSLQPGEYDIDFSQADGTVSASNGYGDNGPDGCFYADVTDISMPSFFFIVEGKVKVEYSAEKGYKITVNGTSYLGSTVNAVFEGELGEGGEDDPYDSEPQEVSTLNFNATDAMLLGVTPVGNATVIDLFLTSDQGGLVLELVADDADEDNYVPAGEYTFSETVAPNNALAFSIYGYETGEGCYFMTDMVEDEDGDMMPQSIYYLEQGKVNVTKLDKGVKIVVAATSHFGSTINAVFEGEVEEEFYDGLEVVKPLDTDAPMFNVLGMEVNRNYKGIVIQNGNKYMLK